MTYSNHRRPASERFVTLQGQADDRDSFEVLTKALGWLTIAALAGFAVAWAGIAIWRALTGAA